MERRRADQSNTQRGPGDAEDAPLLDSSAQVAETPEDTSEMPGAAVEKEVAHEVPAEDEDTEEVECDKAGKEGEEEEEEDSSSSDAGDAEEAATRAAAEQEQGEEEEKEETPAPTDRQRKLMAFLQQMAEVRGKISERREAAPEPQETTDVHSSVAEAEEVEAEEVCQTADQASTQPETEQGDDAGSAEGRSAVDERMEKMRKMRAMLEGLETAGDEHEAAHDTKYSSYVSANEKYDEGDVAGAVAVWSEMLRVDPNDADIWHRRGKAMAEMGDHEKADADMTEALRRNPERADFWFSRGSTRSDAGNDEGAFADFEESLRIDPGRAEVWCCRGTSRLMAGDARGAADDCGRAITLDEDCAGAWGLRGMSRLRLGDAAGAAEDCARALEIDPDLDWVRPALLEAEASRRFAADATQQPAMADAAAREESAPGGNLACSHRERGNQLFKRGDFQAAVEEYRKAHRGKEDGWLLAVSNQAICFLKLGEYGRALTAANVCLRSSDAPYKAHFTKFKALAALRDWPAAFAALEELKAFPDLPAEVMAAAEAEERAKRAECDEDLTRVAAG